MSVSFSDTSQAYFAASLLLEDRPIPVRPAHIDRSVWVRMAHRVEQGLAKLAYDAYMVFASDAEADIADSLSLGHTCDALQQVYPAELVEGVYDRWKRGGRHIYPEGSVRALRIDQLDPFWRPIYAALASPPSQPISFAAHRHG